MAELLVAVQAKRPLVHQLANYVTANDCANIVLALGGSPVMADDPSEVQEMVSLASALVLNLGTLNERKVESMLLAGTKANQLGIPVIFDPVGVGATNLRTQTAKHLMNEVRITAVRGNLSEVKTLAGLQASTRGVEAGDDRPEEATALVRYLAQRLQCVMAITGRQDVVTDGDRVVLVDNGHPLLSRVTGTGCMASSLVGTYCGVAKDYLVATTAALVTMGLAGELAATEAADIGLGTFKVKLFDYVSKMTADQLEDGAKTTFA